MIIFFFFFYNISVQFCSVKGVGVDHTPQTKKLLGGISTCCIDFALIIVTAVKASLF